MEQNILGTFDTCDDSKGFFCFKMMGFLLKEKDDKHLNIEQFQTLWEVRFRQAREGYCYYNDNCPIYLRTIGLIPG